MGAPILEGVSGSSLPVPDAQWFAPLGAFMPPFDSKEAALAAYRAAVGLLPAPAAGRVQAAHYYIAIGFGLEEVGRTEEAARLYAEVVRWEECPAEFRACALFRSGVVSQTAGESQAAADFYESAARQDVSLYTALALYHLASMRMGEAQYAEALLALERIPECLPENGPDALHVLLQKLICLARMGQGERFRGKFEAQLPSSGTQIDSWAQTLWMEAGFSFERHGEPESAATMYQRLSSMEPLGAAIKTNLYYRWGLVLEGQGSYGEARQHFAESALGPAGFPAAQLQARWHLARLLFLAEEYAAALPHLEAVQDSEELSNSQRCEARYDIAMVLQNLGRLPEAVRTLESLRTISSSLHDSVWELKVELALAGLYEQSGNASSARSALQRVAAHPEAELLVKRAAFVALGRFRGR